MRNDEFIAWLKGFVSAIDAERQQTSNFSRSVTISIETWQKIKEELNEVEESKVSGVSTPPYFTTSTLPVDYKFTVANKAFLEEDKIL